MGKKYPSALERALGGCAESMIAVIEGVTGPIFDLALHLSPDAASARSAADRALRALVSAIETGSLPGGDPLATAGRALIAGTGGQRPAGDLEELSGLDDRSRLAVVAATALDLDGEALGRVLDCSGSEADAAVGKALGIAGLDRTDLSVLLDERAARSPLPEGLLDFLEEP